MCSSSGLSISLLLFCSLLLICSNHDHHQVNAAAGHDSGDRSSSGGGGAGEGLVAKRNEREIIVSSEFGEISKGRVSDGNQSFQLQFFTLEPNSLLLPVMLHQDMLFYVHTGNGVLSYVDEGKDENESRELTRGDIHRLGAGSIFFLQNVLDSERQKFGLYAIFENSGPEFSEASFEPYSSIHDLVLGFDKKVLQEIFEVPQEVIEEITRAPKPQAIIQGIIPKKENTLWDIEQQYVEDILGGNLFHIINKKKKSKSKSKSKLFNIFKDKPDFQNCNGWSTTVDMNKYSSLGNSQYGVFMVNLTSGSMMGPHWNPTASEIAIVLEGKGMVRVVCWSEKECKNKGINNVEEGDAFVVPRYHPMAHMAFNNETFVFVGFSTSTKKNHPQFLAGQASVLRTLDKRIVARSFGVGNETVDRILGNQGDSVILKCVSCAEEEWRLMEEGIEKEKEAEERRKREEEEEARQREQEEKEVREREEEERRQREAEEAEERQRRQEEEEAKKGEEEAARKREQEEKEAREREEEERRQREEQEAEERQRKQEEEKAKKREEAAREREQEEKEAEKRQEAEEKRRKQEQEAREREEAQKQEKQRQEEEVKRQEEETKRQEEAAKSEEEAAKREEQPPGGEQRKK